MYTNILESIEKVEVSDEHKKTVLRENSLKHVFSWSPFAIVKTEYYKRFIDWLELKSKQENHAPIDKGLEKMMQSNFYQKELRGIIIGKGELDRLVGLFTDDDVKIVLTMKTLNSQVWHNRISSLWASFISVLSLVVAFISISISIQSKLYNAPIPSRQQVTSIVNQTERKISPEQPSCTMPMETSLDGEK